MTKRFDFADSSLELDLCGELFMLDISERTAAVCEGIKRDAREKLSALKSGNGKDVGTDELCRFLADSIDRILGSGAAARVFGSRRMTMLDLTDLICFILSEIRGVLAERARRYRLAEHTDGAETENSAKGAEPAADMKTADTADISAADAENVTDSGIADIAKNTAAAEPKTAADRESADTEHGGEAAKAVKIADTAEDRESADTEHGGEVAETMKNVTDTAKNTASETSADMKIADTAAAEPANLTKGAADAVQAVK